MKTLLLTREDLANMVHHVGLSTLMDRMITYLDDALKAYDPDQTRVKAREGFHYTAPHTGLLEWMPSMQRGGQITVKLVGYHPENPTKHHLPTILSTLCAFDTNTGHLLAVMDGTFATALRTGAASAVASRVLARPDSRRLTIIGCGAAAVSQLHALSRVFQFEEVQVFDTNPTALQSFAARVQFLDLPIHQLAADQLSGAISTSDMVCTATSVGVGEGPVFQHVETRPWLHVNAVGSDFTGKIELPRALVEQSTVCPDCLEQAMLEGECQQVPREAVGPTLVNLVQKQSSHASLRDERTVFDSTGWALEDQVALAMLMELAAELKLGRPVQIACTAGDNRDPYAFVRDAPTPSDEPYLMRSGRRAPGALGPTTGTDKEYPT